MQRRHMGLLSARTVEIQSEFLVGQAWVVQLSLALVIISLSRESKYICRSTNLETAGESRGCSNWGASEAPWVVIFVGFSCGSSSSAASLGVRSSFFFSQSTFLQPFLPVLECPCVIATFIAFHIRLEIAPWKFKTALRKKRSR
ncbi:uncharacterized protein LOC122296305 isoform X3 [Carya illinoinensis]|nr:uncharacterized protein LOC122296305 isoform X3 [Carya illinoinensis]